MTKIKFLVLITLTCLGCNSVKQTKENPSRPNILLINVDDLGWKDVGFMGSKYYETPNIDALAREGMIFTDAYAAAANCAPSRACLMSGQWTPRHGIYTVASSERGKSQNRKLIPTPNTTTIPENNILLPQVLKEWGYTTCHAGKWHLSDNPLKKGFDVNIGGCHAGYPGSYYPPYTKVPLDTPNKDYYLTNLVMDKTLNFVRSTGDKPFFLYYSPYAVHTPIQPVQGLLSKYQNREGWNGQNNPKYATMIENLDIQVGRLIQLLTEIGKLDNTLILFTSDNGGVYKVTKQKPLRAGKGSYYEGGIREPMFAFWKGKIKAGSTSTYPITNLDFYPTILDVTGIATPSDKVLDGTSIVSVIKGNKNIKERPLFWHFPIYLEGGNKESQDPLFRSRPGSAIRLGDWKLIEYFEDNNVELYNLKNDISENNNVIEENPNKASELLDMLKVWRKKTNAPVPTKLNPDYHENEFYKMEG